MRGLLAAVMASLAAGIGCGSILTLDPGDGSPPVDSDANASPEVEAEADAKPDGGFAADADGAAADGDLDSGGDGEPVMLGSLSCGPSDTAIEIEAVCFAAVAGCPRNVTELPDGGEPCVKTDASAARGKYCTDCVSLGGLGGKWKYTFRECSCN